MNQDQNMQVIETAIPNHSSNSDNSQPALPKKEKINIKFLIIGITILLIIIFLGMLLVLLHKKDPTNNTKTSITPTIDVEPVVSKSIPSEKIILKKGVLTQIPNTNLRLIFVGRNEPEKGCNDCITSTDIQMNLANQTFDLHFNCGGFTGECSIVESGLGYVVELKENLDPDQVIVLVKKK